MRAQRPPLISTSHLLTSSANTTSLCFSCPYLSLRPSLSSDLSYNSSWIFWKWHMEMWTLSIGTNTQLTALPPKLHLVSSVFGLAVRAQDADHSQNRSFASNCYSCLCFNQWLYFKWLELHNIWLKPLESMEGKWENRRSVNLWLESKYLGPVGLI